MGHSQPLFLYFRLFYKQLTVNKCSIKVADDCIQFWVLWYWKQPLCQLLHNHCPWLLLGLIVTSSDFNEKLLWVLLGATFSTYGHANLVLNFLNKDRIGFIIKSCYKISKNKKYISRNKKVFRKLSLKLASQIFITKLGGGKLISMISPIKLTFLIAWQCLSVVGAKANALNRQLGQVKSCKCLTTL